MAIAHPAPDILELRQRRWRLGMNSNKCIQTASAMDKWNSLKTEVPLSVVDIGKVIYHFFFYFGVGNHVQLFFY